MIYVPRDYMDAAIAAIETEFAKVRSTLAVLATGSGKTWLYLKVCERFLGDNLDKKALIVAHREELISQPAKRWRADLDEWPLIEMGELKAESSEISDLYDSAPINGRIVLASIQTLNSGKRCACCTADCDTCARSGKITEQCQECDGAGQIVNEYGDERGCRECDERGTIKTRCKDCEGDGWFCTDDDCEVCFEHFTRRMQKFAPEDFGLIVIDEAHHCTADTYTRLIRWIRHRNPSCKLLGLTATPDRADEEALGQIFDSVAYEYSLPQPILDGWLTPVDQQFIVIEELNLANVRTTAGDLNSGDLEAEMTAERVLHKVTTPVIEIACGVDEGTIDTLVKENRVHDLPGLCVKSEPTLIHAVDVAHAERMTEIINRYLPDSALCIIGTTPKNLRRDGLKRFAEGGYQFLLSCGVFLEGTDLPNVGIVAMARPTKSRALYSQMAGRGLRPLSGVVDGILDAEGRVKAIAESGKPRCLLIDFVGNSGRHKLITSADILGDALPDELVEGVIRKVAREGQPVDMLKALMEAQLEAEKKRQDQARRDAATRTLAQEEAKRRAAERRAGIVAGASYSAQSINPFDVMDVSAKREPGWHKGRKPSDGMKEFLTKAKVPFTPDTSFWDAHLLIEEVIRRRKTGLCTYSQAAWLRKNGYSPEMTFDECRKLMDAWSRNGWRRPHGTGAA